MASNVTTAPGKRVALYARISTTGHGQDVGLQLDELRRVCTMRGWIVVDEFVDQGVSGGREQRPALDRLMACARAGKCDIVAAWRFDRFARSTQHLLRALEEFRLLGVEFVSIREAIDTSTAVGKMIFTFLSAVSEFERALIRERVQAGVDRAKANGKHCGRPRRELDLRAARLLLDQGHSVRAVADMLGLPRGTVIRRLAETEARTAADVGVG